MICNELKKIFRPGRILIVILVMLITLLISTAYKPLYSPYFSWFDFHAAFARELQANGFDSYTDDAEEWMRQELDEIYEEYEKFFREDPLFYENGIVTYEDFANLEDTGELASEMGSRVFQKFDSVRDRLNPEWKREIIEGMLAIGEQLKNKDITMFTQNYNLTPSEKNEIEKIVGSGKWRSLLPEGVVYNTNIYWQSVLYGMILCVFILIAPYMTTENVQKVRTLQYVTKTGRKVLNTQLIASIAAALIYYVIAAAVFMLVFTINHHYEDFAHMGIFSLTYEAYRLTMPYGIYLIIILMLCLASVLVAAMVAFAVSLTSMDYISCFLKAIPAAAAVCLIHSTFMFNGNVFSVISVYNQMLFHIKGIELILSAIALTVWALLLKWLKAHAAARDLLI